MLRLGEAVAQDVPVHRQRHEVDERGIGGLGEQQPDEAAEDPELAIEEER